MGRFTSSPSDSLSQTPVSRLQASIETGDFQCRQFECDPPAQASMGSPVSMSSGQDSSYSTAPTPPRSNLRRRVSKRIEDTPSYSARCAEENVPLATCQTTELVSSSSACPFALCAEAMRCCDDRPKGSLQRIYSANGRNC